MSKSDRKKKRAKERARFHSALAFDSREPDPGPGFGQRISQPFRNVLDETSTRIFSFPFDAEFFHRFSTTFEPNRIRLGFLFAGRTVVSFAKVRRFASLRPPFSRVSSCTFCNCYLRPGESFRAKYATRNEKNTKR